MVFEFLKVLLNNLVKIRYLEVTQDLDGKWFCSLRIPEASVLYLRGNVPKADPKFEVRLWPTDKAY